MRRNVSYQKSSDEKGSNSLLLDVFVIGSNAHEQLNRFFSTTSIFNSQQNLLQLTSKMEMLELGAANQAAVDNNGPYDLMNGQNLPQSAQQMAVGQMNLNAAHLYRNHQQQQQHQHQQQQHHHQQQQQQQQMRLISNQKVSRHRELPVDVPDSFVGIAKQSPRYPPPKPHRQVSPSNNLTTFIHSSANQLAKANEYVQSQGPAAPPIAQNTAASIVTHNASLRSSIKLKQLEKSRGDQHHGNYPVGQLQPAVNQAFEMNEDESVSNQPPQQVQNIKQQSVLKVKQSMPDLCSIYNRLQKNFLNGDFTDATGDAKLVKLLSIYNTIVSTHDKQLELPNLTSRHATRINAQRLQEPVTYKVTDLLQSVLFTLREEELTSDAVELLAILCKHEMDGVCSAFDRITQSFEFAKSTQPASPQSADGRFRQQPPDYAQMQPQPNANVYPYQQHHMNEYDYTSDHVQIDIENNLYQNSLHPLTDIDLDGTCTKTVRIEKNANQPLGATIRNEKGRVVIGRIICGGAAYNSGLLNEGDELLEVNGVNLRGKNVDDVINILQGIPDTITFTIISKNYKPIQRPPQEKVFVRAFFDYDGEKDQYIPCKELGLSFERGEILTIIDRSDAKWWQAHREGDSEWRLAGLIPSIDFKSECDRESNNETLASAHSKYEKKNLVSMLFNCPKGSSPRRGKKLASIPYSPDSITYYEEVDLYFPNVLIKRPIILVGPKMIGQREIVARLLQEPKRFASAISHTTKPPEPHERNGVNFHFVSRAQFQADMEADKFIEYGDFQNHYYGTSYEAMKEVVKSKKICVHLVNPSTILRFRQSPAGAQLMPFFVFVKPDDSHPEKLRNIVASFSQPTPKSNIEDTIKQIKNEVKMIETFYLPYFDLVLTVSDIDRAYQELYHEIEKLDSEPQWIPKIWKEPPPPANSC